MTDITVLILAAGKCSRFWPLKNKNTYSFLGKPLILHQIERLKAAGFEKIITVVNKENDGEIKSLGLECVLQEGEGQASAVLAAENKIDGPVLIMNADDVFDAGLLSGVKKHLEENKNLAFLTAVHVSKYFPGGYFKVDNGFVKEIIEKPGENNIPSSLFRLVLDYYPDHKSLFKSLHEVAGSTNQYEDVINKEIQKGIKFSCFDYSGIWGSIKYPWHVLDIMAIFLDEIKKPRISPSAQIDKTAVIQGNVWIEDGVKVFENAKIVGPCYIGKNAIIGNNVILRYSMIGEGSVLGYSTDVARSYIGKNCWFHSNYLGDSILEENVSLGAGANLANLRLDENDIYSLVKNDKINSQRNKLGVVIGKNVRIGINATVMPGVKIGSGTFIGSGVILEKDVLENKFAVMKTELIIKENTRSVSGDREEFKKKI